MVESVRRTLKRLSADADWPDRSARPGLLPECVSTGWPRVLRTRGLSRTRVYTLEYARERTGSRIRAADGRTDGSRVEQVRKVVWFSRGLSRM